MYDALKKMKRVRSFYKYVIKILSHLGRTGQRVYYLRTVIQSGLS